MTQTTYHIEVLWGHIKKAGQFNKGFSSYNIEAFQEKINEVV
jgi:hypothetical protein